MLKKRVSQLKKKLNTVYIADALKVCSTYPQRSTWCMSPLILDDNDCLDEATHSYTPRLKKEDLFELYTQRDNNNKL